MKFSETLFLLKINLQRLITTLGTQAPPEAKSAKVNYRGIGDQAAPDDKSAKVNYDKGNQDDPEDKSALVNYVLGSSRFSSD